MKTHTLLVLFILVWIQQVVISSVNFCQFQSTYQEQNRTETMTVLLKISDGIYRNVDSQLGTVIVTLG